MTIKTFIVEDEVNARKALMNMLSFYCEDIELAGFSDNIADSVAQIEKVKPHLLLLDVRLPDGTGFDLVKKLKYKDFKLVFVTAYDEYALRAIKLSAIDYLLKPVKPDELRTAINKVGLALETDERLSLQLDTAIENFNPANQNKKIILNTSDSVHIIEIASLIRCESSENYTMIYIEGKSRIVIAKTLKEFEEMLGVYGFFRVHQSHLVNLQYVNSYDKKGGGVIILKNDERIPLSTRRKEGFLKALRYIAK